MAGKTTTIRQREFIPAAPADVYGAFMDSKKHSEFTGSKAKIDARVGGKFSTWDGYSFGKNVKLVKGKRAVQEWMTTEWPAGAPPSIADFSFKPAKEMGVRGTLVVLVQTKVPLEQAAEYAQGWKDYYWKSLREYFSEK